jgi:threonine dehydratase
MVLNSQFPDPLKVAEAEKLISEVVKPTPLTKNYNLSERFHAEVLLKREDLQVVRSYKIRGAFNKIKSIPSEKLKNGVVCASAGNHAQGVALSCRTLGIMGTIFMPTTTPKQKIGQVKMFGNGCVDIVLEGDTFDEANKLALKFCKEHKMSFIHPFDDHKIIEGQATVGYEIDKDTEAPIDYLFIPIGGGGLAAGVGSYMKQVRPDTKIIGVEPEGARSMQAAFDAGHTVELPEIDKFIDGAAVKKVGELTYNLCKEVLDDIISVPEGQVCTTILELYNQNAIVAEPAGALSIAALGKYADKIKGKRVVCIVSGSNNDITRMEEIRERSLLHEGYKHYFIIRFPQRAGALLNFVQNILGPNDDITHFSYQKKNNRDQGPALIGIELTDKKDFSHLLKRMDKHDIIYEYINNKQDLFGFLI